MIIANAAISFLERLPPEVDPETGFSRPGDSSWSSPIPCQLIQNESNLRGMSNGERVTAARYTILIEQGSEPLPASEQVKLVTSRGEEIGEFSLLGKPVYLDGVSQIKIQI